MTEEKRHKSGAGLQVIGCVLLFLGALNTMLSVKGGFEVDFLNPIFMIAGVGAIATGIWRSFKN